MRTLKKYVFLLFYLFTLHSLAQVPHFQIKKTKAVKDTILIDTVSINPSHFKILDKNNAVLNDSLYFVNYTKAKLLLKHVPKTDSIIIEYLKYPSFLTQSYYTYSPKRLINTPQKERLYTLNTTPSNTFKPFEGLSTSGSITRGLTIGNNQNTTSNANLDLQITGKLSNTVQIRAALQDNNIPLQQGGYSQQLDEFDQIFIELFSKEWSIKGGDLFLENRKSKFLNFNKKVQGVLANANVGSKTQTTLAGAIVKGQYAKNNFIGQEGNQGPYKLTGSRGELYVLLIAGSEKVYANGILLQRGENNQYTIDYNAGEITFTSLFPIHSEMRITIEYQYSERSYTRFVTYGGGAYKGNRWGIEAKGYSENDAKNQPLQQSLTTKEIEILQQAGDNEQLMNAPSGTAEKYDPKITLYKKHIINGITVYEHTTNEKDEVYQVKFSYQGKNKGNYIIKTAIGNGRIYQYTPPIAGILQGDYEPIIKLVAPTKLQIASITGYVNPFKHSNINFEIGISNNDRNLFSTQNDANNIGIASKIDLNQQFKKEQWLINTQANWQFIQSTFKPIERLNTIEFNRDWNLKDPIANQNLVTTALNVSLPNIFSSTYTFEHLQLNQTFKAYKHNLNNSIHSKNLKIEQKGSFMNGKTTNESSTFLRNLIQAKLFYKKNTLTLTHQIENNQEIDHNTKKLTPVSQRFTLWGTAIQNGDTTKVHTEIGATIRKNDSLQQDQLRFKNLSKMWYLKSQWLQNDKSNMTVYINYRTLTFANTSHTDKSLNGKLHYKSSFLNQLLHYTTTYETQAGTLPQQEYNFIEVEPGRGLYAWNDYNQNTIKEIQEFEIAKFSDQATYIKVYLPNQIYLKTQQNKLAQDLIIQPTQWKNKNGILKFLSHFSNQTTFTSEKKEKQEKQTFNLNPFEQNSQNTLAIAYHFKNTLYFNKLEQKHNINYNYTESHIKNQLLIDVLVNKNTQHQIRYTHLITPDWLLNAQSKITKTHSHSIQYPTRNYTIVGKQIECKIGYLFTKNTSLNLIYEYQNKENTHINTEKLSQHHLATTLQLVTKKNLTLSSEIALINNTFTGNAYSPVGFQILEGLQPNKNYLWQIQIQKNITQYLDIHLNYQARKTQTAPTIHTGNLQLRAYF